MAARSGGYLHPDHLCQHGQLEITPSGDNMSISFYDASVGTYQQILSSVAGILEKGAVYAADKGIDTADLVSKRLSDDMMPLHFQVVSAAHHSLGAIQGMAAGKFAPPSFELDKDYAGLQALIADAQAGLDKFPEAEVEALAEGSMVFALGKREMPFTNKNFLMTFSLPNFYFHATTTYDLLRAVGTPLGKMDFLGQLKVG